MNVAPPSTSVSSHRFSRWLLPAAVCLALAGATVAAWRWQSHIEVEAKEFAGIQQSAAIASEIRERLRLHAQFLRSLQAFASTAPRQDFAAWRRYAEEIESTGSLSGLTAFAYAPAVRTAELEAFTFATRRQVDRNNFRIFPNATAPVVAPIVFISPDNGSISAAIGFDVLSEKVRREAIQSSVTRREVAMSGPIVLVHDDASQRQGFLLVQAIYEPHKPLASSAERERAFAGVVITGYRTDDFLASLKHGPQRNFALQVFDESLSGEAREAPAPSLIYDSDPSQVNSQNTQVFRHEIDFGGRNWILLFRPRPEQGSDQSIDPAKLILVGGLLGSALLALLVFYLTTHRERAERYARQVTQELRQHRDHLHELVAERTARLDEALHSAQAASHAKSEFLANMSHELRTPMHAILGFSQLGDANAQSTGNDKLAQYFRRIEQSANRLLALINELLNLSKLQAGRVELALTPTDLLDLLHQTVAQLESLSLARHLKLDINSKVATAKVIVDPKLMQQVIVNLLSNAIKFSPDSGTIRILLEPAELPTGRRADDTSRQPALAIRIFDSGIGIPEKELEIIFDKFVQSSATRSGAGGTGLGLAISRAIVSQHRGTIVAANNIEGGACFTVTLPINRWTGSESHD